MAKKEVKKVEVKKATIKESLVNSTVVVKDSPVDKSKCSKCGAEGKTEGKNCPNCLE